MSNKLKGIQKEKRKRKPWAGNAVKSLGRYAVFPQGRNKPPTWKREGWFGLRTKNLSDIVGHLYHMDTKFRESRDPEKERKVGDSQTQKNDTSLPK